MVWYVGQNYSDKWLRQTPSQWAVNKHHLDRWTRVYPEPPHRSGGGQSGDAA
jgi:hypothetical protein